MLNCRIEEHRDWIILTNVEEIILEVSIQDCIIYIYHDFIRL